MLAVESMLSTSFCVVPDFRRVDPVRTSGPTTGRIEMSAMCAMAVSRLQNRATVVAPRALA
jgi:hypothetical protein